MSEPLGHRSCAGQQPDIWLLAVAADSPAGFSSSKALISVSARVLLLQLDAYLEPQELSEAIV